MCSIGIGNVEIAKMNATASALPNQKMPSSTERPASLARRTQPVSRNALQGPCDARETPARRLCRGCGPTSPRLWIEEVAV